jgi:hypothetical protein
MIPRKVEIVNITAFLLVNLGSNEILNRRGTISGKAP